MSPVSHLLFSLNHLSYLLKWVILFFLSKSRCCSTRPKMSSRKLFPSEDAECHEIRFQEAEVVLLEGEEELADSLCKIPILSLNK